MKKEDNFIQKGRKLSNAYINLILRLNKKEKYNDAKNLLNSLQEVSANFFKRGEMSKAALFYILENLHNELKEQKPDYNEEDICCEE